MSLDKVFFTILDFIYYICDFTYNAIFYRVSIGDLSFPLWQIFGVVGVGVIIIAIIIKIIF